MKFGRAILLGFTVPDKLAHDLFEADPIPAVQTHKFAWSLAGTLSKVFDDVFLLSAPPVQAYPITPFRSIPQHNFEENGFSGTVLGGNNTRLFRHLSRLWGCCRLTRKLRSQWRPNVVFVHGVHTPFLLYASTLRRFGVKTVAVLTDAPGVILPSDGMLRRLLKKLDRHIVMLLLKRMDAIVALSPALAETLAPKKPKLVVPGIISDMWLNEVKSYEAHEIGTRLTITYAGGIEESYGIGLLVGAAALLPGIDFRIFGRGGFLKDARSQGTPNVLLPGFLGQEDVAPELMSSDLLINPRLTALAFAAMSFPSKLLEYLATGRPVLTTRVPSIPAELDGCFYYLDEETSAGVAATIQKITESSDATLQNFGIEAKQRAVNHFGEDAVARKLKDFLTPLLETA